MLDVTKITFEIDAKALHNALKRCLISVSTDETRYYLNGVFMHKTKDGISFAATDGHRLSVVSIAGEFAPFEGVILPIPFVKQAIRLTLKKPVRVTVTVSRLNVRLQGNTIGCECTPIDGTFPEYHRVTPCGEFKTATGRTSEILKAVAAVTAYRAAARDYASELAPITMTFGKTHLTVSAECYDGTASTRVPVKFDGDEGYQIKFNGLYLVEAIESLAGQTLRIRVKRDSDPILIDGLTPSDNGAFIVLMPLIRSHAS